MFIMLNKKGQLSAISWKCDQLGISYGKLVNQCSHHELMEIYREYEEMLIQRQKEKSEYIPSNSRGRMLTNSEYKCWNDTIAYPQKDSTRIPK